MKYICSSLQELSEKTRAFEKENSDTKFSAKETEVSFIFEAITSNNEIHEWHIGKSAKFLSSDKDKMIITSSLFIETIATVDIRSFLEEINE